ncbi:cytochrome p450, partial [Moniliophthora roreri MCA 2997]
DQSLKALEDYAAWLWWSSFLSITSSILFCHYGYMQFFLPLLFIANNIPSSVIGVVAAFDYQFGAMEDTNNQITQIYRSTFANIFGLPSKEAILSMALAGLLPRKCLTFLHDHLLGSQCLEGLHSLNKATNQVMRQLVREKAEEIGQGKGNKDTISLLVKANLSENEQLKISDNKLIAHMSTIFIAEHETTANSLFWTLLELSQHSEVQKWLRDEIWMKEQEVASRGNTTGMLLYLDAVVKVHEHSKTVLVGL